VPTKTVETLQQEKLELEVQKIRAEKEKTELEIKDLKRPPYFRSAFVTVLGPALLSLFAAMMAIYFGTYSPQIAKLDKASEELKKRESEVVAKATEIEELDNQISNLTLEKTRQAEKNEALMSESIGIRKESEEAKLARDRLGQDLNVLTARAIFEQASLVNAENEKTRLGGELVMAKFEAPYSILREAIVESQAIEDVIGRMRDAFASDSEYRQNFRSFLQRTRTDPREHALALMLDYRVTDNLDAKKELVELGMENPDAFPLTTESFGSPFYPHRPFFRIISTAFGNKPASDRDWWTKIDLFSRRLAAIRPQDRHQYLLEFSEDMAPIIGPPVRTREERNVLLDLVELARGDFQVYKLQYFNSRSSGGSEILFQRCRIAFFAIAGDILADPSITLEEKNLILSRIGVAGYAITNNWSLWVNNNEALVRLWTEPGLPTLRTMSDSDFEKALNTPVPTKVY
jgi:hypothetical protein